MIIPNFRVVSRGRMVRQNAHLPVRAGQDDDICITFKDHAVLRNNFTTNGHSSFSRVTCLTLLQAIRPAFDHRTLVHEITQPLASFSAFSRTSSIVPTIMKACSGRSSHLPSRISRKPRTVSLMRHILAGDAGEQFRHEERLGEEALDLAGTRDHQLVIFAQVRQYRGWR